jgi:chemotaxis protein MotB
MKKNRKKDEDEGTGGPGWIDTYSDMMTLLLCFFAIMFNPTEITEEMMAQIRNSMELVGIGALVPGGKTATVGRLKDRGGSIDSLPANTLGKTLGEAARASREALSSKAQSIFATEIRSNKVRVTTDERGVVISLMSDLAFAPGSDKINVEETRDILWRLASFMSSDTLTGIKFKIEGHTDGAEITSGSPFTSNWQLSVARAISVLTHLSDLGVDEQYFEVSGFADTMPFFKDATPEARAYNRRIDIVLMSEQVDTF